MCSTSFVITDNAAHDRLTKLTIETPDFPGLIRVISWVLNGLMLRVEKAHITTDDEDFCHHVYWVSSVHGAKLSAAAADNLADRLRDFITSCKPLEQHLNEEVFSSKHTLISNTEHPQYSRVTVKGEPDGNRPGFLLELASVLTGLGFTIHEAIIQGCSDCGVPVGEPAYDPTTGRLFVFWVTDRRGNKLDFSRAQSLVYTMGLVLGSGNGPTTPPNLHLQSTDSQLQAA